MTQAFALTYVEVMYLTRESGGLGFGRFGFTIPDEHAIHGWLPGIRFLSLLAFSCLVVGFPFNPLKVKLLAGDLRRAQNIMVIGLSLCR